MLKYRMRSRETHHCNIPKAFSLSLEQQRELTRRTWGALETSVIFFVMCFLMPLEHSKTTTEHRRSVYLGENTPLRTHRCESHIGQRQAKVQRHLGSSQQNSSYQKKATDSECSQIPSQTCQHVFGVSRENILGTNASLKQEFLQLAAAPRGWLTAQIL